MKKLRPKMSGIWQTMTDKLANYTSNISEDVFADKDEVKAFGELALLKRDIEQFLTKYWDVT